MQNGLYACTDNADSTAGDQLIDCAMVAPRQLGSADYRRTLPLLFTSIFTAATA